MSGQQLRLGVLLPHTKLYGGVKRFLELGNRFVELNHEFTVYTPDGEPPAWFDFHGRMATFDQLDGAVADALFTTTVRFVPMMHRAAVRHKVFYHVRKSEKVKALMRDPEIDIMACSGNVYEYDLMRYRRQAVKGFGGVTLANYPPRRDYAVKEEEPFVVMAYGRLAEKVKGTRYVVGACERLYARGHNVRLLLYDTPTTPKGERLLADFHCRCPYEFVVGHPVERNGELFARADCFVSAENPRYSGWNNTVAEAMASGLPVVSTSAGTADLLLDGHTGLLVKRRKGAIAKAILQLKDDGELRRRLGTSARDHVARFDWMQLARSLEAWLRQN